MVAYFHGMNSGHVFVTLQHEPRCNAWGQYVVTGALFDTVDGTVQPGAVATCNLPASVRDIVAGVAADRLNSRIVWTRAVSL